MPGISEVGKNIFVGPPAPDKGSVGKLLGDFGAGLIIGHPTFKNHDNIGRELNKGIAGAAEHFKDRKTAFFVSDGSLTRADPDTRTQEESVAAARAALASLPPQAAERILVFVGPYEGYGGNMIPGKGSALRYIFEEMAFARAEAVVLLDGDLRNDVAQWLAVYRSVMDSHALHFPDRSFFITARYARHFVDASITRFVVGPLTTLMGTYVPGGISGDIVLSAGAAALERRGPWSEARYRFGTDISTTFDNIAHGTAIYEVYLGAKLHDVTDDSKLSVMPGEVIGAALERLLYYEKAEGRVTRILRSKDPVGEVIAWGSSTTGIAFINPGDTGVFDLMAKRSSLVKRFESFRGSLEKTLRKDHFKKIEKRHARLASALEKNSPEPVFLDLAVPEWIGTLHEVIGYALATGDLENPKRALNYLYTAAFLEFCREKLSDLGYRSVMEIEAVQRRLGVDKRDARSFYAEKVEKPVRQMAMDFYKGRQAVLDRVQEIRGGG